MRFLAALLLCLLAGCGAAPERVGSLPALRGAADVFQIHLSLSNVFLIRGPAPVLIDCGTPGDEEALTAALAAEGLRPEDIRLCVITHGHADHAGLGKWLQARGVKVALGAGDVPLAAAGHNDEMKPTNLTAWIIRPFVNVPYEPFAPDIAVEAPLSLEPWGLIAHVVPMPGHTAGSLVVLSGDQCFVGDMILGGYLGAFFLHTATEHYYQADLERDHANVRMLLDHGIRRFYLGHGGPVEAESVRAAYGG